MFAATAGRKTHSEISLYQIRRITVRQGTEENDPVKQEMCGDPGEW